ncbi:acyl-CoA dehydrogenase [Nocardia sp. BMG51109]|uniref:acyl-CoA dehydrogenase family protein n=1 Tax=Nocardia sp. BMG51109 TaxID=1056816 RepID=UPI0018DD23B2|nr:acyl-CoA dehydrogenase [Nocardia sp. BMG51109]
MSTESEPIVTARSESAQESLRHFVFPPQHYSGPDGIATWLSRAIPAGFFHQPDDLNRQQRIGLSYARAAEAGKAAPRADVLLAQPPALAALLARAASADPAMFHILLVHYTLVLAPILASDPHGRSEGLDELRSALQSMTSFGSALMTEAARSNSQVHLRTEARFDPLTREFILHTPDPDATKFPNSAGHPAVPKIAAVYARLIVGGTDCGIFTFVLPIKDRHGAVAGGVQITPAPATSALACDFAYTRFCYKRIPFHSWLSNGARIDGAGRFHDPASDPADHGVQPPDPRAGADDSAAGVPLILRSVGAATSAVRAFAETRRPRRRPAAPRAHNGAAGPDPSARLTRTMSAPAPHVWRSIIAAAAGVARESAILLHTHTTGRLTMGRLAPEQPLMRYRSQQEAVLGSLSGAYVSTVLANHVTGVDRIVPSARADTTWAPWSAVDPDLPLLKAATTRMSADVIAMCRARSGSVGFVADDRLNGYHGLVHAYFSAGGDNELILLDTAHAMARPGDDRSPAPEFSPPADADPTMPRVCLALAHSVERYFQQRLINAIAAATRAGDSQFTAWNDNLALARTAGAARADRIVIQLVGDAADTAPHPISAVLRYHLLSWVEQHAGSVTDQLLVAPHLLERVWQRRRALCDELLPHVPELVCALQFPDR